MQMATTTTTNYNSMPFSSSKLPTIFLLLTVLLSSSTPIFACDQKGHGHNGHGHNGHRHQGGYGNRRGHGEITPPPPPPSPPPHNPPSGDGGSPPSPPSCPPPQTSNPTCPADSLKLGVCVDLLGGLVHGVVGDPVVNKCCPILGGLVELEAAVCLCTTIRLKVLDIKIYLPLALKLLITCGKNPPPGFTCPAQ